MRRSEGRYPDHPIRVKVAKVETFSLAAIADWAQDVLARECEVISDRLACFRAVVAVGCVCSGLCLQWAVFAVSCCHQPVVINGRHPKDLPDFRWINTVISNLKTQAAVELTTPYALTSMLIAIWRNFIIDSIAASIWKR
jgi:hypothetical protein